MTDLPLLGAALTLDQLPPLRGWLLEEQRDIELHDFTEPAVLDDWGPLARRARAELAGHIGRRGIHGPFWGLNVASPDPMIRAVVTRRLLSGVEFAAAIGATQMVVHSPYTTWDHHNLDTSEGARARMVALSHHTLCPVVERAEEEGVTLVLENIEDKEPELRCLLADSFGSIAVAVSVDTGHAHYAHGSTGAPPVDFHIRRVGTRLRHIHLQDADGYADRHWQIGLGSIRWHSVFEALAPLGPEPRLILELRDPAAILPSAAWLRAQGLAR